MRMRTLMMITRLPWLLTVALTNVLVSSQAEERPKCVECR